MHELNSILSKNITYIMNAFLNTITTQTTATQIDMPGGFLNAPQPNAPRTSADAPRTRLW